MAGEPLTVEQFRERVRATQAKCLECGHESHSLVEHLRTAHGLSSGQYRKKYPKEQFPDLRLASPIVQELLRRMPRQAQADDALENFITTFVPTGQLDRDFAEAKKRMPPAKGDPPDAIKPTIDRYFEFPEEETKALLVALTMGKNVYISGPTGCGKTELVFQVLARIDRALIRANMHGDVTAATFIGQLRASAAKGGTYTKYGMLPNAMKHGTPLLIDEIDYTPPNIGATLNATLEGRRTIHLPDTDETITAEPGFTIIATANTGGKGDQSGVYTGTEVLNTALLDRFAVKLSLDYLPERQETAMLGRRFPSVQTDEIAKMTRAAGEVRTAFKQGNIAQTLSTRKLIEFFQLKPVLGELPALRATTLNWLDEDDSALVASLFTKVGVRTK